MAFIVRRSGNLTQSRGGSLGEGRPLPDAPPCASMERASAVRYSCVHNSRFHAGSVGRRHSHRDTTRDARSGRIVGRPRGRLVPCPATS